MKGTRNYPEPAEAGNLETVFPFLSRFLPRSKISSRKSSSSLSSDSRREGRVNPLDLEVDAVAGVTITLSCVSSSPSGSASPTSFPNDVVAELLVPATPTGSSSAALLSSAAKESKLSSEGLASWTGVAFGKSRPPTENYKRDQIFVSHPHYRVEKRRRYLPTNPAEGMIPRATPKLRLRHL